MKYIFITGVSSGIGRASLDLFVQRGEHVIGTVRKSEDKAALERQYGDKVTILTFDVRDVLRTTAEIHRIQPLLETQGLGVLINNAGLAVPGPLELLEEENFELQLDVNVKAVRRITNLLLPYLGTDKKFPAGRIINISSISGLFSSPINGAYSVSKFALESMTDVYRRELMFFGIQVIAIEPGPIQTPIWQKNLNSMDRFEGGHYDFVLKKANKMIEATENKAQAVHFVTKEIERAAYAKNPPTRILIHQQKFIFRLISRWLPDKWVDRMIKRTISKGESHRPF